MTGFFADGKYHDLDDDQARALAQAIKALTEGGNPEPVSDARRLWAHFGQGPDGAFADAVARRADSQPMSQTLGYRDFYKHRFRVTPDVLDPRPDTETLIDVALAHGFDRVLDLGTGSGCILVSLLADRPEAQGVGADLSDKALTVARHNAQSIGVADRAEFVLSNWFENITGKFNLIVSNPPYIAAHEMDRLQRDVHAHEPRMALTDEADGLSCYRAIISDAHRFLAPNGRLVVEIGPTQGTAVRQMMTAAGFADCAVTQDIDGRDRVVSGHFPVRIAKCRPNQSNIHN